MLCVLGVLVVTSIAHVPLGAAAAVSIRLYQCCAWVPIGAASPPSISLDHAKVNIIYPCIHNYICIHMYI